MSTKQNPVSASGIWQRCRVVGVCGTLLAAWTAPVVAAEPCDPEAIATLRAELDSLRSDYAKRLARLEAELARLEAAAGGAVELEEPPQEDDVERLRAAAREAAGVADPQAETLAPPLEPAGGRGRNLNRLNPEISFTGNVLGIGSDSDREEFEVQEFELDLQANLDPYSKTRWTVAFTDEEAEIEEGYVLFPSLPAGLSLTAGKFRQQFGVLNRQHLHALPQTEYPLVLTTFLSEEALAQTGLSLRWLVPRPWAHANELTFEVTDGSNEAFGGDSFERLVFLGHLKNFWDVGRSSYLEWGLGGVDGETADGGTSRVLGTDFTFNWRPPSRKDREITWRTEVLFSDRDDPTGIGQEAWGGYSYLETLVARGLSVGLRVDRAEDPLVPSRDLRGLVPYVTWWQSEWVRLRGEYQYLDDDLLPDAEHRFVFQITWAAGPHKHDTYQ
jgi:hypothetical protein